MFDGGKMSRAVGAVLLLALFNPAFVLAQTCTCDSPLVTGTEPCCTFTIGWWWNHNKDKPQNGNQYVPWPTNCTYLPNGEDSILFGGLSALDILGLAPKGGDKCYGLGHQFIAAAMNNCQGACTDNDVSGALADAYTLLTTQGLCPGGLKPNGNQTLRAQAISLEDILEGYNSGDDFGPGHCGSESPDDCPQYDCEGGCTYTQGYWKTHAKYPVNPSNKAAKPNKGGKQLISWIAREGCTHSEDDILFGSYTWFDTLVTAPTGGNACLIAGKQYVAARLNIDCNDACIPNDSVSDALACVHSILNSSFCPGLTPGQEHLTEEQIAKRTELLTCAGTLDAYNNGYLLGPGHCEDTTALEEGVDSVEAGASEEHSDSWYLKETYGISIAALVVVITIAVVLGIIACLIRSKVTFSSGRSFSRV